MYKTSTIILKSVREYKYWIILKSSIAQNYAFQAELDGLRFIDKSCSV